MILSFHVSNLRNISSTKLKFGSGFNFIIGENASGKTSLLEAIYLLGTGRSFRSSNTRDFIHFHKNDCTIFGQLVNGNYKTNDLALRKSIVGENKIFLNGKSQNSIAPITKLLPMQIIGPDLELISDAGSNARRQFIDWGLFYENENYGDLWKKSRKILIQRNALLKQAILDTKQLDYWDIQWSEVSHEISQLRFEYLNRLVISDAFKESLFWKPKDLLIEYQQGWPYKKTLIDSLASSRDRDRLRGHTQYGIHRDDIKISSRNRPATEILSRGQKKLMTLQLRIAQAGELSEQRCELKSIFLLDDLASELDITNQKKVIQWLIDFKCQVFITSTQRNLMWERMANIQNFEFNTFHVEQGGCIDISTHPFFEEELA